MNTNIKQLEQETEEKNIHQRNLRAAATKQLYIQLEDLNQKIADAEAPFDAKIKSNDDALHRVHETNLKARAYSHAAHDAVGQRRKYTNEPYWVHTDEVAEIVHADSMLTPVDSFDRNYMLEAHERHIASFLHDTLEDTKITMEDLTREFGPEIAGLVLELTDLYTSRAFPHMSRRDRKAAEADRLAGVSNSAKTVKLADLLSNTASIVAHDPDFAVVYLAEKAALLPRLKGGSPMLYARVEKQLAEAVEQLRVRKI